MSKFREGAEIDRFSLWVEFRGANLLNLVARLAESGPDSLDSRHNGALNTLEIAAVVHRVFGFKADTMGALFEHAELLLQCEKNVTVPSAVIQLG